MNYMVAGGGTAGHVYPALAVIEEIKAAAARGGSSGDNQPVFTWVGSPAGLEGDIVRRSGITFRSIGLQGGLRGVGLLKGLRALLGLAVGLLQSVRIVHGLRPQAILATGGYVSVAPVVAGWLLRVPVLLYLPDMAPGWAVRFLAPFVRRVAVTTEESCRFFAARKVVVTGYPVRPAFFGQDRKAAREAFGLDPEVTTVLVAGGSRGAHRINVMLGQILPHLLLTYQVIHVTGMQDAGEMRALREELPELQKRRYRPYAFLHEDMARAFAAADLVVCRAGASVLGEIPAAGVAAVLIPFAGGHRDQELNAAYLVGKGAAVQIADSELSPALLEETISGILNDPDRLARMRQAAAMLAKPDAARTIAAELQAMARR